MTIVLNFSFPYIHLNLFDQIGISMKNHEYIFIYINSFDHMIEVEITDNDACTAVYSPGPSRTYAQRFNRP